MIGEDKIGVVFPCTFSAATARFFTRRYCTVVIVVVIVTTVGVIFVWNRRRGE